MDIYWARASPQARSFSWQSFADYKNFFLTKGKNLDQKKIVKKNYLKKSYLLFKKGVFVVSQRLPTESPGLGASPGPVNIHD